MTCHDAAVLAITAARSRQLQAALVRFILDRPTEDDLTRCSPRGAGESLASWIVRLLGPGRKPERVWTADRLERSAEQDLAEARTLGVQPIHLGHAAYPELLAAIDDPPPLLWVWGNPLHLSVPAIAVVGSRAATHHGLEAAWRLGADLASAGVAVVSGLARGVDSQAHEATLSVGGRTVAVLGSGHARIYPAEHRGLAERIVGTGAVISEFPADTPPRAHHFPLRNRIISGLSRAVVVVEAAEKSGALITASCAAAQGREVFVIPGAVIGGRNRGGHLLIRDGARLVESAEEILVDLGHQAMGTARPAGPPTHGLLSQLPEAQEFTVEDVAASTGWMPAEVLARLLELEVSGRIQRIGGARFVRISGRVLT
jgi:DNA processing protein